MSPGDHVEPSDRRFSAGLRSSRSIGAGRDHPRRNRRSILTIALALLLVVLGLVAGGTVTATATDVDIERSASTDATRIDVTSADWSADRNGSALNETSPANFSMTVDATNSPVTEGGTMTVDATVDNVGGQSGTQTVSLSAGGSQRDATSVTLDPGSTTTVSLSWATTTGDAGTYTATLASANDTATTSVSIHSEGSGTDWPTFGADNRNSGHLDTTGPTDSITSRWTVATGGSVRSSPTVVDGTVYVGSTDGNLRAIDTATGDVVLNVSVGGDLSTAPTVVDDTIYFTDSVANFQNHVRAIDADTGDEQWNYSLGGASTFGSVAVASDTVYVGSADGNLSAIDADTGVEKWATRVTSSYQVDTTPAVDGGAVYAGMTGPTDVTVRAIRADNGNELWNTTKGNSVSSSPAMGIGILYYGTGDGTVYALDLPGNTFDPDTGMKRWAVDVGEAVAGSPAVSDGIVYVGSTDGNVYALDTDTGTQRWNYSTGGSVLSSPAVVDGTVYVGSDDGNVYALDAHTGTVEWNYSTGGPVRSSPAVVDGTVYVGSDDGNVYALSEETPSSPTFEVSVDESNAPITEGDTLSVNATIENTGGMQGTQSVSLSVDGTERFTSSVTIEAGGIASLTLSWDTSDGDAGDYTISVASANNSDSANVSVTEAESDSENGDEEGTAVASGGSSGGAGGSDPNVGNSISVPFHDDVPGEDGIQIHLGSTAVREISFGHDAGSGQVTVESLKEPPAIVANQFGPEMVVTAVNIEVPDAVKEELATVQFRLDESDIVNHTPDSLRVVRVVDSEHQELQTVVTEGPDGGYLVEADTPGFSSFAVISVGEETTPTPDTITTEETPTHTVVTATIDDQTATSTGTMARTETPGGLDGFGAPVALGAVILTVYLSRRIG
jgi:PGF-pre-PGF domain-containing protein